MSIWFIIAYLICGVVALGIIGYAFVSKILERNIGDDFMEKKNEQACDELYKELDPKIGNIQKSMGYSRCFLYGVVTLLCWPISTPYMLHKINRYGDYLEDYIRTAGRD